MLQRYAVARVGADPPITDGANAPSGWDGIAYFRLHGAPRVYCPRHDARYSRLGCVRVTCRLTSARTILASGRYDPRHWGIP